MLKQISCKNKIIIISISKTSFYLTKIFDNFIINTETLGEDEQQYDADVQFHHKQAEQVDNTWLAAAGYADENSTPASIVEQRWV